MTQRISGERELPQKPSIVKRDDDVVADLLSDSKKTTEGREKENGAAMKSVLDDKDSGHLEEEDTLGNLEMKKVAGPKVSKYARFKKLKSQSKIGGSASDLQEATPEGNEFKRDPTSEPLTADSSKISVSTTHSKPFLESKKSSLKEAVDEPVEPLLEVRSRTQRSMTSTTVSNAILPVEEPQRNAATEMRSADEADSQLGVSKSMLSTLTVHERGNYLSSMSPQPLDEYGADDASDSVTKSSKQ